MCRRGHLPLAVALGGTVLFGVAFLATAARASSGNMEIRFGKSQWGMTLRKVKRIYPSGTVSYQDFFLGDGPKPHVLVPRYSVDISAFGMPSCRATFVFFPSNIPTFARYSAIFGEKSEYLNAVDIVCTISRCPAEGYGAANNEVAARLERDLVRRLVGMYGLPKLQVTDPAYVSQNRWEWKSNKSEMVSLDEYRVRIEPCHIWLKYGYFPGQLFM